MKFWNLEPVTENGEKVLDVSVFGEIDPGFFADGVASKEIAGQLVANKDAKKIKTRINSVGGDLFGGLTIYNLLRGHGAEIEVTVEGVAASAASIIAMAGDKVVMGRGAMLMIHNPMTFTFGDAEDHRQNAEMLDKARDSLLTVYQKKTGKKPAELKKMLDAETWLTAEEAKREGFADEIADKPVKAKATAEGVVVNSVTFGKAALPASILALAAPQAPAVPPAREERMDKEKLKAEHPDVYAAIFADGEKSGTDKERARISAIDDLPVRGQAKLIRDAKYGAEPKTAEQVAVAMLKAEGEVGANHLAARERESKDAAGVKQSTTTQNDKAAEEQSVIKAMVAIADRRRGGVK